MATIVSIIGARPQFIKAAPVEMALAKMAGVKHYSIHTGQHYDANMSQVFFDQLGLEKPYANLQVGSGTHATQTAAIMVGLEPLLDELKPDLCIVYGDTNSTIAATLVASKMHIPIAHVEAGLRSFNRQMPEEINRVLTDHASDLLFAPTKEAAKNLKNEGLKGIYETGDVMLDMIKIAQSKGTLNGPAGEPYYYATLHRPYNTDDKDRLLRILDSLNSLPYKTIFSIHPRTRTLMAEKYGLSFSQFNRIEFIEPQGYFENLGYLLHSQALITDSGGMQKEAYFLQKHCITIRSETEWVETLENNCNILIWYNLNDIEAKLKESYGPFNLELYGKGDSAAMIAKCIESFLFKKQQAS